MRSNLILATDSYKTSHFEQYPPKTTKVTSYIEARPGGQFDKVVFFGLQAFIRQYLLTPITLYDIVEARMLLAEHGVPFNEAGWKRIVDEHDGLLPITIEAIPEGSVVPVGTPLVQIYNNDPELFWLTSYMETALLRAIWYPTTVATLSWHARQSLRWFVERTTDLDVDTVLDFMLHDFGARGVSSAESAVLGGIAHLINFKGTDTVEALVGAIRYYDAQGAVGYSVPASEHSTMTAWGRDGETAAYRNMLEKFPAGIVSIVSDSYDYGSAVSNIWCDELKDAVNQRAGSGRVVIRPDSGDPVKTVLFTLEELEKAFGVTQNIRGYKVLPDHVRILWGDGIGVPQMEAILSVLWTQGWAAENVVFGMGGGLLQKVNRDTLRFAMKANEIVSDGEVLDISKSPKGDASKASKAGAQSVLYDGDGLRVIKRNQNFRSDYDLLQPQFSNGGVVNETTFEEVRERAKTPLIPASQKKVA